MEIFNKLIESEYPIMNASGVHCTTLEQLKELDNSNISGIISKSCSLEKRDGNEKPKYYSIKKSDTLISLNSNGLENLSAQYYVDIFPYMKRPYFISIAGFDFFDRLQMIQLANSYNIPIELNLSCPNVKHKPIIYDFQELDKYLEDTFYQVKPDCIGLKLPPYFVPGDHEAVSMIIKKYPIKFITCINSISNCLILNENKPTIKPNNGIGGLGGSYLKPIGLGQVKLFRNYLDIPIIGCGGIFSGRDIIDYSIAGANIFQIGTCLYEEGISCIDRIKKEINENLSL